MNIETDKIKALEGYIANAENILITGHISPDGDAMGSCIALMLYIHNQGKQAKVMVPNRFASMLSAMPHIDEVIVMEDNKPAAIATIKAADLIFSLDYNTYDRVSAMKPILEQSKATKILIDHHLYPADYFNLEISYPEVSSTSLLLYNVLCNLGAKDMITKDMAECIYTGMMTDTGNFSYNSNDPKIYTAIASLLEKGIDKDVIYKRIFNTTREDKLRLLAHCLSNMVILEDIGTAYICLTLKEQEQFNYQLGDTEGVVNIPLQIDGISKSVLLKEDKDKIKLSFRSEGEVPVNTIAENFGGGGHKNAAGGESYTTMEKTLQKLIPLMK